MYDLKTMQRALALTTAGLALTAAPALARPDYPLSHVAATTPAHSEPSLDLRSPDAVDAAGSRPLDLRSPDAADAASSQTRQTSSLAGTISASPQGAPSSQQIKDDDGLDWGSIGIGAGAVAAIALIGAAGVGMTHRTRMHPAP